MIQNKVKTFLYALGLVLIGIACLIAFLIRFPALPEDQVVSISTPPETEAKYQPYFSLCDSIPCSNECDDPFDPRLLAPSDGPFSGQCLNTQVRRSVRQISSQEALQHGYFPNALQNDKFIYVANVYHQDSVNKEEGFFVARVDTVQIREVILQVEHAGGIQGHAQLRFRFLTPDAVTMVPQRTTVKKDSVHQSDLFYSVEAQAPSGVPYKGDYAFRGIYVQSHRMATLYVRARVMIQQLHRPVWQYVLDKNKLPSGRIFIAALEQSTKADAYERYHTARNNCILKLYDVMNRVWSPEWYRRPLLWITDQTLFMPTRAKNHLWYRGLLGPYELPNMEAELGWENFLNSPTL